MEIVDATATPDLVLHGEKGELGEGPRLVRARSALIAMAVEDELADCCPEGSVKISVETCDDGKLHSMWPSNKCKPSTIRAGLSKLTAGRPHLEVVKTRKEHEAPRNQMRTTLDLRLS